LIADTYQKQTQSGILYSPMRRNSPYSPKELNNHLIKIFADTVTGPYKGDIAFLLEGNKGSGKSYASLRIAYNSAQEISRRRHKGDPDFWEEYFNVEENVAVIDPIMASTVIGHAKMYNIYLLDDIGVGWSARGFSSKQNRDKGDIFQINRVARTVQIMSVPAKFLLDKIPRSLVNYVGEMVDQDFARGYSTMKVFKPQTLYRMGKQINPALTKGGAKVVRYVVERPPGWLADRYDTIRAETTKRIIRERTESMIEAENGNRKGASNAPAMSGAVAMYQKVSPIVDQINDAMRLRQCNISAAIRESDVTKDTWYRWMREGYIVKDKNGYRSVEVWKN